MAQHLGIDIQIVSGDSCLPYEGWGEPRLQTPEPIHDPFLALNQLQYRQVYLKRESFSLDTAETTS